MGLARLTRAALVALLAIRTFLLPLRLELPPAQPGGRLSPVRPTTPTLADLGSSPRGPPPLCPGRVVEVDVWDGPVSSG